MTDMILVYITCDNPERAKAIGTHLLKKRLAACINIIPGMNSKYFWPPKTDKFEEANETILIVKTLEGKFSDVEREVKAIHPSDTPCIISIPVSNVSKKYYEWIKGEIK
jgi:periplasmic divalent cation tolerance protein